jgi:LysR family transcriptional regulator, benzoate and cis,cis-muconate-responsive activator of ben and cat genes
MIPFGYQAQKELRHLRYFVTVAEELNVRQASTRLHLAALAEGQIHDLEDEVGTKLFVGSRAGCVSLKQVAPS